MKYFKKVTLILVLVLSNQYLQSQNSNKSIIGKWKDIKLPYKYSFTKTTGTFTQSGYPVFVSYQIDSAKTPMWIDFTIKQGRTIVIPGLMKWKGKDTLWIQQFPPYSKHPIKFDADSISDSRKIHILVRQK